MKLIIKWLTWILLIAIVIVVSLVGPIARTPLHEQSFYQVMMAKLDTLHPALHKPSQKLKIGWGKYNITTEKDMPMAGYTPRYHFESVHDSLYARILAIDNGKSFAFIISIDLLIFPPSLKEKIQLEVTKLWPDAFVYLSATHTHNGLGGWDDSIGGQVIAGNYNDDWITKTSDGILQSLKQIKQQMIVGSISYYETDANGYTSNRLAGDEGKVDAKIRGLKIVRNDSTKAIVVSFSAHATSISKKIKSLSGDYPAVLVNELEKSYDFGMFMAGMVGSHRLDGFTEQDFELAEKAGKTLANKIITESIFYNKADSVDITAAHIPVQYGPSQLRIEKNWRLRSWVFNSLLGPLQGEITLLAIGDIILLGTSCDFSGEVYIDAELEKLALSKGKKLIITSFNGNYTGYITLDDHYDRYKKEEVRAMNWVGPNFGNYYEEIIKKILTKD